MKPITLLPFLTLAFYMIAYEWQHPELTRMQLFQKTWPLHFGTLVITAIVVILVELVDKRK